MAELHPFDGFTVDPAKAERVVAPGFDTSTAGQRRRLAETEPESFLHVLQPQDPTTDRFEEALDSSAIALDRLMSDRAYVPNASPCLYIYSINDGSHAQTAVVGEVPVEALTDGTLLPHEQTSREREARLTRFLEVVGVAASPIGVTYRSVPAIQEEMERLMEGPVLLDFAGADGVRHRIWEVADREHIDRLTGLVGTVPKLYLTDGHHRAAAAIRFAESRSAPESRRLLAALFPHTELRILPYNRQVAPLAPETRRRLLQELSDHFDLAPASDAQPGAPGEVGLLTEGRSYRFRLHRSGVGASSMDANLLQEQVLAAFLGVSDARADDRLIYLPGGPHHEIPEDSEAAVFLLYPVSVEELIEVAEAGGVMPPKSTWFSPKPRSGIFLRVRR